MALITVFGSINYDLVTTSTKFPEAGETLAASRFETHHGGKGANQAVAARRLSPKDVQVCMVGRVGNDSFGKDLIRSLKQEGIDTAHIEQVNSKTTGTASIFVDEKSGENRILVFDGANGTFTDQDIPRDLIKQSDVLVVQNEIPTDIVYKALSYAALEGVKTVFNPSPMPVDEHNACSIPLAVLADVTHLIVNTSEADLLMEKINGGRNHDHINDNIESAMQVLPQIELYARCKNAIITLGANGCVYRDESGEIRHSPAGSLPAGSRVIDTTGAGDTFLGAFVAQIATNVKIGAAIEFAAKASAIAVTRRGAQESIPSLGEI